MLEDCFRWGKVVSDGHNGRVMVIGGVSCEVLGELVTMVNGGD